MTRAVLDSGQEGTGELGRVEAGFHCCRFGGHSECGVSKGCTGQGRGGGGPSITGPGLAWAQKMWGSAP